MKYYVPLIAFISFLLPYSSHGEEVKVDRAMLGLFQPLPESVENPDNPFTEDKINLGRMLYFDKRLSADRTISCASCHHLESYGDNGARVPKGINGLTGDRNSPTVYNAALHISQFWDGREPDVEHQAMGPPLNGIEMGMKDGAHVESVLKTIPGYVELFGKVFPEDPDSITFENMGKAIGAFERKLLTPSPFDAFLKGDEDALTNEQKQGLNTFITTGCITCHNGAGVGGHMYQKVGLVSPWEPPLEDTGREKVTGNEADRFFLKVPSLRNITETGPYMHHGEVRDLREMVKKMAFHQLGREISDDDIKSIVVFLGALKGELPMEYIKEPELPADGPDTPKP
tara:strand:- start:217 stop:1245 length:1029 start_codon:yes stop_codon:yes gene_type:complete